MDELIDSRLKLLEANRDLGASQLAKEALEIVKLFIEGTSVSSPGELVKELTCLANKIKGIRPSMYPIISMVDRFLNGANSLISGDIVSCKVGLIELLDTILLGSSKAKELIRGYTKGVLTSFSTILTHSYSSTIVEVFSDIPKKDIIVTESRPLCEGIKLANILTKLGHNTSLITDMQSGHFLSKCDVVVVGADSIFLDGTFINKMGTCVLAVLAKAFGIPFYVVSEADKIIPHSFIGSNIELEEKSAGEVFNGQVDFTIRNIYFDITPSIYITRFITEKGIFRVSELEDVFSPTK